MGEKSLTNGPHLGQQEFLVYAPTRWARLMQLTHEVKEWKLSLTQNMGIGGYRLYENKL